MGSEAALKVKIKEAKLLEGEIDDVMPFVDKHTKLKNLELSGDVGEDLEDARDDEDPGDRTAPTGYVPNDITPDTKAMDVLHYIARKLKKKDVTAFDKYCQPK